MYDGAGSYYPFLNFAWEAAHVQGPDMEDEEALRKRQAEEVAWVEKKIFDSHVKLDPKKSKYTLKLLPEGDACISVSSEVEPVALARIVRLNGTSEVPEEYTYPIEPRYIDEARTRLREYYETRAEPWMKRILDMSVQNFFGGWEALEKLDWGIMRFGRSDQYFEPGFRAYLEGLAV